MLLYAAKVMRDSAHEQPDAGLPDRPQRPRRPALRRGLRPAPNAPARAPRPGRLARAPRTLLKRASGGIIFTTLQKFGLTQGGDATPVLTDRRNVVVADEAHRSQYGSTRRTAQPLRFVDGLAKHMRDALPERHVHRVHRHADRVADKSTRAVFGDYIDVYDLTRAVEDGATVKIFYESRLAKVEPVRRRLRSARRAGRRDHRAGRGGDAREAKSRWARLEAIVGAEDRLDLIAQTSSSTGRSGATR